MKSLKEYATEVLGISYHAAYQKHRRGKLNVEVEKDSAGNLMVKEPRAIAQVSSNQDFNEAYASLKPMEIAVATSTRSNKAATIDDFKDRFKHIENIQVPYSYVQGGKDVSGSVSIREAIILCQKAYYGFSAFRMAIDIMEEFATGNIYFTKGNKKARDFFQALFRKININQLQSMFYRELFRSSNVFIFRYDAKIKEEDIKNLTQVYGAADSLKASSTVKLPIAYMIVNPADIICNGSASFISPVYYKTLNGYEIERLRSPQTEEDKEILNALPAEVKQQIKQKKGSISILFELNKEKTSAIFWKKQSYEALAVPLGFGILDDINYKKELKLMDMAITRTVQQAVLLVTHGYESKDGKYQYNRNVTSALDTIFKNESVGRVLISDFTTKVDFKIPQIGDILDPKKYTIVNEDIQNGLVNILTGGSGEKFANQQAKIEVFVQRLRAAREIFLNEFLMPEVKRISEEMGFKNLVEPRYEEIDLKDDSIWGRIYAQLAQLGILTPEETIDAMETGKLPTAEDSLESQKRFKDYRDNKLFLPLSNVGKEENENMSSGRPPGTPAPQTPKKSTPMGQKTAQAGFSMEKVTKLVIEAEKLREEIESNLKKKHKLKSLSDEQLAIAKEITTTIIANEDPSNWLQSKNDYLENPIDKNQNRLKLVNEICLEHEVDTFTGAILLASKKD